MRVEETARVPGAARVAGAPRVAEVPRVMEAPRATDAPRTAQSPHLSTLRRPRSPPRPSTPPRSATPTTPPIPHSRTLSPAPAHTLTTAPPTAPTPSRLKPIHLDALSAAGLPSKGDTTLFDPAAQERYFELLVERCAAWDVERGAAPQPEPPAPVAAAAPEPARASETSNPAVRVAAAAWDDETADLAFLSLASPAASPARAAVVGAAGASVASSTPASISASGLPHPLASSPTPAAARHLTLPSPSHPPPAPPAHLLSAMRKLRESLTATSRTDAFALTTHLFLLRTALSWHHLESWIPSLTHLTPPSPLLLHASAAQRREVAGYAVLDLACRERDLAGAVAAERRWLKGEDGVVLRVLRALVRGEWGCLWGAWREAGEGHRALMGCAVGRVREHVRGCLGRAYFEVERGFVERCLGMAWEEVVAEEGTGWEIGERGWVVIRRQKAR